MGRSVWAPAFAGATMRVTSARGGAKQIVKPERISDADDVVRRIPVETERDVEIDLLDPGQQISLVPQPPPSSCDHGNCRCQALSIVNALESRRLKPGLGRGCT